MRSRKPILAVLLFLVVAVAVLFGLLRQRGDRDILLASGTVEATEARLGFPMPGVLEEVAVREGDQVKKGMELARLDRAEAMARRAQACAQVAAAEAVLAEATHGFRREEIAQGRSARGAAGQRMEDARRDLDRVRLLHDAGAVSQEALEKAQLAFDLSLSQFEQAADQLRLLESGPRAERVDVARAQLAQIQATVKAVEANLELMAIRSPFDGVITVRHREPGEAVSAGFPVVTVMNPDDRWVRVYIPETRLGAVRIGQSASISSDTFPDKRYRGEVVVIASQAEFTPKTVQTSEERVKLVYAVKVRITDDPGLELKPGMPADVRLHDGSS